MFKVKNKDTRATPEQVNADWIFFFCLNMKILMIFLLSVNTMWLEKTWFLCCVPKFSRSIRFFYSSNTISSDGIDCLTLFFYGILDHDWNRLDQFWLLMGSFEVKLVVTDFILLWTNMQILHNFHIVNSLLMQSDIKEKNLKQFHVFLIIHPYYKADRQFSQTAFYDGPCLLYYFRQIK